MAQLSRFCGLTGEKFSMEQKWARCAMVGTAIIPVMATLVSHVKAYRRRQAMLQQRKDYVSALESEKEEVEKICQSKITEERAIEITSLSFKELQAKLQNGELLCVDVLYAYQRIALNRNKTLNFIVQPVMEAEEMARKLDSLTPEERKALPLFGIPISVKENYMLTGYFSTAGMSKYIGQKREKTSGLVQGLVDSGAVPFIRTNVSQTMMSLGAHNPIYGQSRNPQDISRSPGGSSAGEGPAIGSGASLLGLGSDIGGSIRVPAAWCGICGLKPTVGRFSLMNNLSAILGQTAVRGTSGFMARDVETIVEATKAVSSDVQFNVDQSIPRVYFNEQEYSSTKPLTIGYVYHWPPVHTTESTKRAITDVVAKLSAQGHNVVEWKLPEFEDMPAQLVLQAYFGDGGAQMVEQLEGDDVSYIIKTLIAILRLPAWIKKKIASIANLVMPSSWIYRFVIGMSPPENVDQWFRLQIKINKYRQLWIDDWKKQGIDVIIAPPVPVPAEIIDEKIGCDAGCGSYVYLLNMVNFPAGVVPYGKISTDDEVNDLASYPDTDLMHRRLKKMIRGSAGLALSIQCAALPYREEMCLRVMNLISNMN